MAALSEKQKQALLVGGIAGLAILLIAGYFYLMFVRPEVQEWNAERVKLEKEVRDNTRTIKNYNELLADKSRVQALESQFSEIAKRLPAEQDPIEVFDLLRGYFEGTDVGFTFLDPGLAVNHNKFTEFPFTIRGTARYHEFGQLVNLVECNPDRLMRVSNFRMTNNNVRPSIHPMEIGITTFTFNNAQ
jgi:Tfp pilus assembly protein PilO